MKTLHTIYTSFAKRAAIILTLLLTLGVTSVWGAEEVAYTFVTVQNSTNSSYASTYDVTIDGLDWNVPGNQNFNGYMRIGGKEITNVDRVITGQSVISDAITKIILNHKGLSVSTFKVNSITVTVASDDNFSTIIDEVTISTPTLSKDVEGSITFTPNISEWKANSYYKISFNVTYTAKSNNGLNLASIVFYKEPISVCTVTYDANDATGGSVPEDNTEYASGASVTVLDNTGNLVKDGYNFDGWQIDKTGTVYTAGQTFNISSNVILYAKWSEKSLTNYRTTCTTEPSNKLRLWRT